MTDKQSLARWNHFVKMVLESTSIVPEESEQTIKTRVAQLEANPEEWFKYYFPAFAYAPPADFHLAATRRILENPEWCEVRMWARELAKSTRTMMETLYLCLTRKKKYVLLISNSLDNAVRLLMPYKANLECNKRIIQDYGLQEQPGSWTMSEFTTEKGVAFRAIGAGQSPRGTRNEEARPDMIIFDDLDTDEDCLNPDIIAKKWRWIEEAAISTRSVSCDTTIIFCGNRIALDCCAHRATNIADHVDEINIRDKEDKSVWWQKNKEVDIDRVLSQKSYAATQKEYFNNPINQGSVFTQMSYKSVRHISEYSHLVCYTDPSYKDSNDYKATVLVGAWSGEFHVIKCFIEKTTSAAMLEWHYHIMNLVGNNSCYYFMEASFMQDVLVKELSDAATKRGRPIPLSGDTRQKKDKFMRIECLLEPLNRNGNLYLNAAEKDNPNMKLLEEQFTALSPGSRAHDDGPDAVEGAIWILSQKLNNTKSNEIVCISKPENRNRL